MLLIFVFKVFLANCLYFAMLKFYAAMDLDGGRLNTRTDSTA